jgi:DeoR/GlpR family transcriptional regulator of sugar metabolism
MADAAPYLSAVAALAGTFSGGVTSVATSWLGQQLQTKEQRRAQEKAALQTLYKEFIESASRLYLDAWSTIAPKLQSSSTFIPRSISLRPITYKLCHRLRAPTH